MSSRLYVPVLKNGCALCGKEVAGPICSCRVCNIVRYCNPGERFSDFANHKVVCKKIAAARERVALEKRRVLDANEFYQVRPGAPFEEVIQYFCGYEQGNNYLQAAYLLIHTLADYIDTRDSVKEQLEHLMNILRLSTCDLKFSQALWWLAPALMLRLGEDQECYNLVKRYATTRIDCYTFPRWDSKHFWDKFGSPGAFEDLDHANAFEPVDSLCRGLHIEGQLFTKESFISILALLKIRMLLDLQRLRQVEKSHSARPRFPREVLNQIKAYIPLSSIIANDRKLVAETQYEHTIQELMEQIGILLCEPKDDDYSVFCPPFSGTDGREEPGEILVGLLWRHMRGAWLETPLAEDQFGRIMNDVLSKNAKAIAFS